MIQTIYIHILSVVHQIFYWKKGIELPAIVAEIKTPCKGFTEMNF